MKGRYRIDPRLPEGEVAALRRTLVAAGWEETQDRDWDFCWEGTIPKADLYDSLRPGQRVSHFPDLSAFGLKSDLHDNLRASERWEAGGNLRRFHPRSFSMPDDYTSWRTVAAAEPEQLWLLKPKGLSQGRGISLVQDLDAVPRDGKWLVQEYLQRPHLIGGHKYVLRFWLLVTSLDPLVCYLHRSGVFKMTSRPYTLDPASLGDPYVHLTNVTVQKRNRDVAWGADNTDHRVYRARLRESGVDDDELFARIRDIAARTAIACREQALMESRAVSEHLEGCFELMGLDVLIDEDLRPWILECNVGPSMDLEEGYDAAAARMVRAAKDAALADLISLLGITRGSPCPTGDTEQHWRQRLEFELSGAAGYERLWPAADAHRFLPCFPLLRPLDRVVANEVCTKIPARPSEIRPAPTTEVHPLGDGLAIFATDQRSLYALNATGAAVWLCLADGLTPDEAIGELAATFPEVSRERISGEFWDLLVVWAQRGLLAGFEFPIKDGAEPPQDAPPLTIHGRRREGLLIVPLGAGAQPEDKALEVPDQSTGRLALLSPGVRACLSPGYAGAALDALVGTPGVKLELDSTSAAALVGWLNDQEIFEVEVPEQVGDEVSQLLSLLEFAPSAR